MCIQSNEIKIINQKRTKNDFTKTRSDKKEQQQQNFLLCVGDIFVFKNDFNYALLLTRVIKQRREMRENFANLFFLINEAN